MLFKLKWRNSWFDLRRSHICCDNNMVNEKIVHHDNFFLEIIVAKHFNEYCLKIRFYCVITIWNLCVLAKNIKCPLRRFNKMINNILFSFGTMECKRTICKLLKNTSYEFLIPCKIILNRCFPNLFIYVCNFQNFILNSFVNFDLRLHIIVDYFNILFSEFIKLITGVSFFNKWFSEQLSSVFLIFCAKNMKGESSSCFNKIIDVHKLIFLQQMFFIDAEWTMFFQKVVENLIYPIIELFLLCLKIFWSIDDSSWFWPCFSINYSSLMFQINNRLLFWKFYFFNLFARWLRINVICCSKSSGTYSYVR